MPKPLARPSEGPVETHSLYLPQSYWDALDRYAGKKGWSRSEALRRLFERAKLVPQPEGIEPEPNGDPLPAPPRSVPPEKVEGSPAWKARMISTGQAAKIKAWDADHEKEF